MGRRRRRVVRAPKRKIPVIFMCPSCGKKSIKVEMLREESRAKLQCGTCTLSGDVPIKIHFEEIDVYCEFIDGLHSKTSFQS